MLRNCPKQQHKNAGCKTERATSPKHNKSKRFQINNAKQMGENYYEYEAQKVEANPNIQCKTNRGTTITNTKHKKSKRFQINNGKQMGGINCPRELYEPEARKIKMVLITYQLQNDHRVAKKHSRAWPTRLLRSMRAQGTHRVLGACTRSGY